MKRMTIYLSVLLAMFTASQGIAQACGANSGTAKTNFGPGNKHLK